MDERKRFMEELEIIKGLSIIPSQANYVMAQIVSGISAKELTKKLIVEYNILIKNLVPKMNTGGNEYIRLAV